MVRIPHLDLPAGGKFTEAIAGRVMQGIKEFLSVGARCRCRYVFANGVDHEGCCVAGAAVFRVSWILDGDAELRQDELGLVMAGVEIHTMINRPNRNKKYIV